MRGVLQRVTSAAVCVDGVEVSKIGRGLLCLIGVARDDGADDAAWLMRKLLTTKLWPDEEGGAWKYNVKDIKGEILLVSQFTLHASLSKPKPNFQWAMGTEEAKASFAKFVADTRAAYEEDKVHEGVFGAKMMVSLVNDGPVTLQLDSFQRKNPRAGDAAKKQQAAQAGGAGGGAGAAPSARQLKKAAKAAERAAAQAAKQAKAEAKRAAAATAAATTATTAVAAGEEATAATGSEATAAADASAPEPVAAAPPTAEGEATPGADATKQ